MPPLRQAMRLVEHPRPDFPLPQRLPERLAPQLLRRHVQQRYIPHRDPVQHVAPLQRRQQPVQRCRAAPRRRRPPRQLVHLILHQRLQRRQHHRQRTPPFHLRQRRKLETQRLSPARRHHRHQRFPRQRRLHHLALHTPPALVPPKILEPGEPAPQPFPPIELLPAPRASRIAARPVPQPVGDLPRLGITPPHPARQHRPTISRHRQPNQHIRQPHPPFAVFRNLQPPGRRRTPRPPRAFPRRRLDLRRGGRRPPEHQGIPLRHPSISPRAQPLQRPVQHGILLPQPRQHLHFPPQQVPRQHRIAQRIVLLPPRRLVVLLQRMIRVLRKTQRRQLQRIHHRQLPQPRHPGKLLRQHPQIMPPHIMPRNRRRPEQRRIQPFFQIAFRLRLLPRPRHPPIQRFHAQPGLRNHLPLQIRLQIQKQRPGNHARTVAPPFPYGQRKREIRSTPFQPNNKPLTEYPYRAVAWSITWRRSSDTARRWCGPARSARSACITWPTSCGRGATDIRLFLCKFISGSMKSAV